MQRHNLPDLVQDPGFARVVISLHIGCMALAEGRGHQHRHILSFELHLAVSKERSDTLYHGDLCDSEDPCEDLNRIHEIVKIAIKVTQQVRNLYPVSSRNGHQ